jgi:protoporphyrin/coproporphyrin ferrochelatase
MSHPGVLLVNLGSPDSPSVPDVRRYLQEFLMDGRVLDAPWPIRFCVVHLAILPRRPQKSAEAYHLIWTPEGSPLIVTSRRVQQELQQRVEWPVELAMRYRNPSIAGGIQALAQKGVDRMLVFPMFPHYAMSSWETAVVRVKELARRQAPAMRVEVVEPYYEHPAYIKALVESARPFLEAPYDHLLFSFHGVPERHLRKSDPTRRHCLATRSCCEGEHPAHKFCYRAQCLKTVAAFVRASGVKSYSVAFQSRLGRDPWLQPYTDAEIRRLASTGIKKLVVICPAFVADCLETIEEIGIRGRKTFQEAGGMELERVPCLNDQPLWVEALREMILNLERSQATS